MKINLPTIKVNGINITIRCDTNDEQSFDLWERLASTNEKQPQTKQEMLLINQILKNSKNGKISKH